MKTIFTNFKPKVPGSSGRRTSSNRRVFAGALALVFTMLIGVSSTYAVAPNAGANIGNVATADYTDGGGTTRQVTSAQVNTTVAQIAGVQVDTTGNATGSAGGFVSFTHLITNTGNGTDTYTFSVGEGATSNNDFDYVSIQVLDGGTPMTLPGDTITLNRNETRTLTVTVNVPGSAQDTHENDSILTATSNFDGGVSASRNDTVTVSENASISLVKRFSSGASTISAVPGQILTYELEFTNNGLAPAGALTITDVIDAAVTDLTYTLANATYNGIALSDADDGVEVASGIEFEAITSNVGTATESTAIEIIIPTIVVGGSGVIQFQVLIPAGTGPGSPANSASYTYNDNGLIGTVLGPFVAGPATANISAVAGVSFDPTAPAIVTIASAAQGGIIVFDNVMTNDGNDTDTFNITLEGSSFPGSAVITILTSGGTPMVDSDFDGNPDVTLAAGAEYTVKIQVDLNIASTGGPYALTKRSTSTTNPAVSATQVDTLTTITSNTVDVTNILSVGGGANGPTHGLGAGPEGGAITDLATNPDNTVTFTLFVNNTTTEAGASSDTFNLEASTDNTFTAITMPGAGWSVEFRNAGDTATITDVTVAPNSAVEVKAKVTVPAGYAPGAESMFFRAISPTSAAVDIKHDSVTVNRLRLLTLITSQNGNVFPNGSVTYAHTLQNVGNVDEGNGTTESLVQLTTSNTDTVNFSSTVYLDNDGNGIIDGLDAVITSLATAGINAGDTVNLIVRIQASGGVDDTHPGNTTTLTVTTLNGSGYGDTPPVTVTNDDNTSVVEGDLTILKTQSLDEIDPVGPPVRIAGVDGETFQTGVIADAAPGSVIFYKILVSNSGTTTATGVIVTDSIPSFTTFLASAPYVPTASYTTGTGTITQINVNGLVDNSTGVFSVNIGDDMDAGDVVEIVFAVQIDN